MASTCEVCGNRLEIPTRGRSPKYCSSRCRQRACRARKLTQLPRRLRDLPRWTAANGKRPITPSGRPASSTDESTWTSYDNVANLPHGIMLGGGIACIDLDRCINRRGQVASWAQKIISTVPTAVVERSVSGRGLHIFGLLPESKGTRRGCAEIYSRARFIRTTENIFRAGCLVDLAPAVTVIERMHRNGEIPKKEVAHARSRAEKESPTS